MQNSLKSLRGATLLAASVLLASACGDSGTEQRPDAPETPAAETERSTTPAQDVGAGAGMDEQSSMSGSRTASPDAARGSQASGEAGVSVDADGVAQVSIGGTDSMQYTLRQFEVEAGQTVELTLTHEGRLGVQVMGHNVVILQSGIDPVEFGVRVMDQGGSPDNEYVPDALRGDVVANTDMIGGGDSTTITFTAPDEPGRYAFVCTFPGHYAAMNGVMTVI